MLANKAVSVNVAGISASEKEWMKERRCGVLWNALELEKCFFGWLAVGLPNSAKPMSWIHQTLLDIPFSRTYRFFLQVFANAVNGRIILLIGLHFSKYSLHAKMISWLYLAFCTLPRFARAVHWGSANSVQNATVESIFRKKSVPLPLCMAEEVHCNQIRLRYRQYINTLTIISQQIFSLVKVSHFRVLFTIVTPSWSGANAKTVLPIYRIRHWQRQIGLAAELEITFCARGGIVVVTDTMVPLTCTVEWQTLPI